MTSGVLYYVWGDQCRDELARSRQSVERLGYPVHIAEGDPVHALGQKSRMYDLTPFDVTAFMDTDTVALADLEFGFEMAERHGLAICINEAADASVHYPEEKFPPGLIEYNTGVIFFKRDPAVERVFRRWAELTPVRPRNDQPGFARAVYETRFNPFVLPLTWNYRAEYAPGPIFGPIHVWHSRVPVPVNAGEFHAEGFAAVKANSLTRRTHLVKRSRRMIRFQERPSPFGD